jgi:hypothetical protein
MECPRCKKKGLYTESTRIRKRDNAICVYGVCRQQGCGYGKLISTVVPGPVLVDQKKQLLFNF